ncbi:mitochondrial inner-membrane-bound regulator-domain-containing protein, partial [Geopyxis carbonaria]
MQSSTPSLFAVCYRCRPRPRRVACLYTYFRNCQFSTVKNSLKPSSSPKDIIILDVPRRRKPKQQRLDLGNNDKDTLPSLNIDDVSRTILTYERETQPEAATSEISLLKPQTLRVSQQRYKQLFDCLYQSFNVLQLTNYYRVYPPGRRVRGSSLSKANMVHQILKKSWGIEIAEEIAEREDLVIKKEIRSNKRDIYFLISNDGTELRSYAEAFSARITVNVADSILEVHASQVGIESIEQRIQSFLSDIIFEDLDLSAISRIDKFDESFIIPVSRTTNTFVEKLDENTLRIFALGTGRENLADARRLIFTSVNMDFRSQSTLMYQSQRKEPPLGALFPISEDFSLPWMFRDREWSRWKELSSEYSDLTNLPESPSVHKILSALQNRRKPSDTLDHSMDVNTALAKPSLSTTYGAVLGHLLHNSDNSGKSASIPIDELILAERPRVLCKTFPGSSFLPRYLNASGQIGIPVEPTYQESFRLRFLPSPWSNPHHFEKYPPVYISMDIDPETGDPHNPLLAALQAKYSADVMLPGQPTDIRFFRKDLNLMQIGSSLGPQGGVTESEWAKFMAGSSLNPIKDHNLRACSTLNVRIPDWMVQGDINILDGITYNFAGMEYRRTITVKQDDVVLSRAAIEGGASGGRKTEFSLSYDQPVGLQPDAPASIERFHGLVDKATNCVASLGVWMREVIKVM